MKIAAIFAMALFNSILFGQPAFERDPNLTIDRLENGMTIAVYKNSEPPNRVSMRLLIRRGSAHETDAERGIAHFIEHMAFNGTKHFPSGEMVEYFQRLGMAFGADTNAHTGFTETVYKLDMPDTSAKLVDDGLVLLRDYCDGMLFEPSSIESERGVIIAEKKSRDDQEYRKAVKEIALYFKGSVYADRMPIGEESVVSSVKRDDFLKFYRQTYAPQNAVLVVVGDISPAKIVADARKIFGDFSAPAGEVLREDSFGSLEKTGNSFKFGKTLGDFDAAADSTPNSAKSYSSITVSREIGGENDSLKTRVREIRMRALADALTARYLRVADAQGSKISGGSAGTFSFDRYCRTLVFSADAPVSRGTDSLVENFRQLLSAENLTDAEISNAKKKVLEYLESEIKSWKTRKNAQIANEIVSSFSDGEIFTSPETDLKIAEYAFEKFNAGKAVKMLRDFFDGARMKIFISDTVAELPAEKLREAVEAAYAEARNSKYDSSVFEQRSLEFSKFSQAGKIAAAKDVSELGIRQIEFANKVRLNIKRTDFAKDEILMKISFGDGFLDIPLEHPEYFTGVYALTAGGTKFQSCAEIGAARFLLKMSLGAGVSGNSFFIGGGSTCKDFESLVRLSATMFADPGFRADGTEALMKYAEAFYLDYNSDPMSQMRFLPLRLLASPMAEVPGTLENMRRISMKELAEWLLPIMKNSYMEISVVGDIEPDEVEKLFAETFGTLPSRDAKKKNPFAEVRVLEAPTSLELFYDTVDEPRSVALVCWFSGGRENISQMRVDNVLGAVLDDVLRKEIREKGGKVYSPFAYNSPSTWQKNIGFMTASTFVVPDANSELISALEKCGASLLAGVSEDEFERAKIPLIKGVEANRRRNSYWLDAVMDLSQARPVNLELAKTILSGYADVKLEDVVKAAKKIFSEPVYKISVMPAKK